MLKEKDYFDKIQSDIENIIKAQIVIKNNYSYELKNHYSERSINGPLSILNLIKELYLLGEEIPLKEAVPHKFLTYFEGSISKGKCDAAYFKAMQKLCWCLGYIYTNNNKVERNDFSDSNSATALIYNYQLIIACFNDISNCVQLQYKYLQKIKDDRIKIMEKKRKYLKEHGII